MLVTSPEDFDYLEIGLASPEKIRFWSYGEVEKPETINYRTFKPERKGLFCEKIFGPVKDWECSCGKYRRVRYRGIVCERCGVQVTHSKVRRERMGHIELASPVTHIWFLKGVPSYMGLLLDITTRQLEEVVYYDSYIVTHVDEKLEDVVKKKQLLSSNEYYDLKEEHGDAISAEMGAKAVRELLGQIDLEALIASLREELADSKGQKRLKITKRLKLAEALHTSGNRPEWMIMDALPVMPPDLRPMVQLEGGRFATSDLNDLYRRVVNRNNRLKRLIDIGAPEMIVRNERRMLQEAVDVLISNGKRGRAVTGSNGRPLKSLGNIIEGKQGRFRQNLLGKRVDYSGRSVIVVGPHLKFHQCGLPKDIALELFKPFVIRKLVEEGLASNVKSAKRKIERKDVFVWDVLEEIIKGQPVLLNRAPTLHRLGIQAFEPILVEGSAIQVHPLVCTAFNADFDGDQMAVHVPLSLEAQAECRLLIMSTNNILSPSNGRSIITPTQDMVLGCYYLTVDNPDEEHGKGKFFYDIDEALRAWEAGVIHYHSQISIRIDGETVNTTIGRVIFNNPIREVFRKNNLELEPFINNVVGKKQLSDYIYSWYIKYGNKVVSQLADELKSLGFKYATLSGISISIDDLRVPKQKATILERAEKEVEGLQKLVSQGTIREGEKLIRTHDVWRRATSEISEVMEGEFGSLNNIFIMANSGARGNIDQVRQLAGMRGLMSDAQGRTITVPIKSNFKEGLSLAEYFISCYGARKGLVDTALRTADSGYLTRRLVDVAQDVTITIEDCETEEGSVMSSIRDGADIVVPLSEVVEGRVSLDTIKDPESGKVIVNSGEIITFDIANEIGATSIEEVKVRGIYTCKAQKGICQKCYGLDLATGRLINLGDAIGIVAAQSIGEPGTQLTMRTFHTGGVDLRKASQVITYANSNGVFEFEDNVAISKVTDESGEVIWIVTDAGKAFVKSGNQVVEEHELSSGTKVIAKNGEKVKAGDQLFEYNPAYEYIVSRSQGKAHFMGVQVSTTKKGKNLTEYTATSHGEIMVFDPKNKKDYEGTKAYCENLSEGDRVSGGQEFSTTNAAVSPGFIEKISAISAKTPKGKDKYKITVLHGEAYPINEGARLYISNGDKVSSGEVLAVELSASADASKTKDIVQGLPRVEELCEARKGRDSAVLSELDGLVDILDKDGLRVIKVVSEDGVSKEHKVSHGIRIRVYSGQQVTKGDQLTDGTINPHDLLNTKGVQAAQKYLVDEIQKVYRSQGVSINIKHIEVIVRQMTRKVTVTDMGDSEFLLNEVVELKKFDAENERLESEGKQPAIGQRVLLGITRASLSTESFISASSFQETAKVLSRAAVYGEKDEMYGLKENVIIGKLIPAGTGFLHYNNVALCTNSGEEISLSEEDLVFDSSNRQ